MLWGSGTGRPRTRLGKFLDTEGISSVEFAEETGLSRQTISKMCSDNEYSGTGMTRRTIIHTLRNMGYDIDEEDLF